MRNEEWLTGGTFGINNIVRPEIFADAWLGGMAEALDVLDLEKLHRYPVLTTLDNQSALAGRVDRASGEFIGQFKGVARRQGASRATTLKVTGRLAAMATLAAVVQSDDDVQGLALGVPLVGRVTDVCAKGRRHERPKAKAAGTNSKRKSRR